LSLLGELNWLKASLAPFVTVPLLLLPLDEEQNREEGAKERKYKFAIHLLTLLSFVSCHGTLGQTFPACLEEGMRQEMN
jgi:hypothetical protein